MQTAAIMSDDQMLCIERPEPGLSTIFEEMYHNQRLVDVTLKCMDGQVHAHKLVLAACSEYFCSLFEDLANPYQYPVIVIKDMRVDDLTLMLEFMYRGRLTLNQGRMQELIKSAENLQIHGLSQASNDDKSEQPSNEPQVSIDNNVNNHTTLSAIDDRHAERRNKLSMYRSTTTLLEQSMITEESPGDNHASIQVSSYFNRGATSNTNLMNQQVHFTPSTSMRHVQQHLSSIDRQQHLLNQRQQQINNNLQVLTSTISGSKSSPQKRKNSHRGSKHLTQGITDHICDICFVSFSRKANLERHLHNLHSIDRNRMHHN